MFSFYINKAFCYPFCFCTFCQHTLGSVTSFSQLIILRDNRVCILYKYFCDDFSNFFVWGSSHKVSHLSLLLVTFFSSS